MIRIDDLNPILLLIDFGLAGLFRNPATYLHTPFTMNHSIIGTLPFTSINGQQVYSQSRRDDLESPSHLPILSFVQHLVICLGLAILQAMMRMQSSERKY